MIDLHESELYVHNLLLTEAEYAPTVVREIPVEWFEPGFSQDCIRALVERIENSKSFDYLSIIVKTGLAYDIPKPAMDGFKEILLEMSGHVEDLQEYKLAIRTSWLLRELPVVVHNKIANMSEADDPFEVMGDLEDAFEKFRKGVMVDVPAVEGLYEEFLEHQREIAEMDQSLDMFYELPSVNKVISNPPGKGRFGVIAGSTSHGKSSLISPLVLNCVENKVPCYVHSVEMHEHNALQKLIQYKTGLTSSFFEQGGLWKYPKIQESVKDLVDAIQESDSCIIERSGVELSVAHVRKVVRVLKESKGVRTFIFDRAELFKEFIRAQQGGDKVGAMTALAAEMRTISTILNVTIILFAQSTNEATKLSRGRTTIGTIYGGRSLTASADFLLAIYNPVQEGINKLEKGYSGPFEGQDTKGEIYINDLRYHINKVELTVLKDTYGGKGAALVAFIPENQRFIDLGMSVEFSSKFKVEDEAKAFTIGSLIPSSKEIAQAFSNGIFTEVPGQFEQERDDGYSLEGDLF